MAESARFLCHLRRPAQVGGGGPGRFICHRTAAVRADLLRAADPRQHRHRPPGQGEHRLRPPDPPARQEPHARDFPHPGHHGRRAPFLYLYYKKTQVKQYLKEGRALRTETTINQPRDFGIGKELTNLAALAEVGYTANRRLLDAECISHDPAAGAAALDSLTYPVISETCTYIPGMRFTDRRVRALLAACCALALRPAGFTSRDLRHYLAPLLVKAPEDMTSGQISYDLRRLRAHQIIQRIPHSRSYQVTQDGLSTALFLTRVAQRLLIPGLAQLASPGPPGPSPLRQADRAYRDALISLAREASIAA